MAEWHPDPKISALMERHFELQEDEHFSYMAHDGEMDEITSEREQVAREIEKAKYDYEKTHPDSAGVGGGQRSSESGAPDG